MGRPLVAPGGSTPPGRAPQGRGLLATGTSHEGRLDASSGKGDVEGWEEPRHHEVLDSFSFGLGAHGLQRIAAVAQEAAGGMGSTDGAPLGSAVVGSRSAQPAIEASGGGPGAAGRLQPSPAEGPAALLPSPSRVSAVHLARSVPGSQWWTQGPGRTAAGKPGGAGCSTDRLGAEGDKRDADFDGQRAARKKPRVGEAGEGPAGGPLEAGAAAMTAGLNSARAVQGRLPEGLAASAATAADMPVPGAPTAAPATPLPTAAGQPVAAAGPSYPATAPTSPVAGCAQQAPGPIPPPATVPIGAPAASLSSPAVGPRPSPAKPAASASDDVCLEASSGDEDVASGREASGGEAAGSIGLGPDAHGMKCIAAAEGTGSAMGAPLRVAVAGPRSALAGESGGGGPGAVDSLRQLSPAEALAAVSPIPLPDSAVPLAWSAAGSQRGAHGPGGAAAGEPGGGGDGAGGLGVEGGKRAAELDSQQAARKKPRVGEAGEGPAGGQTAGVAAVAAAAGTRRARRCRTGIQRDLHRREALPPTCLPLAPRSQ